ncbi:MULTISPECIES: aminotransferase class V-fold PLP-dependent enzyme [unclassified Streptomyces]|uniref:pyridoxal phosphate-dependent decarboxylase family protein n=1 Tax=unclassified Streptomyces TaxID=2593676 RepID=UPI0007006280|nr:MULTISPECIES: aminotransferase class V-fold PLP-dependent enzyme [unclassified Streptomyces]KQX53453.1 amino acid decarboxylase [Streptomyces sp. Root1304]KRA90371.1 amino acid decarboxylase [Streptomyces sp. Root66D1]
MRAAPPPLAGGAPGAEALRPLLDTVLDALREGARNRGGPLPAGGPEAAGRRVREALGEPLPATGRGADEALRTLVHALAEGAADPAHPLCAAHLHTPPLALAAAADLAASALNPSMDSWDQAPAASALEALVTAALAAEVFPAAGRPDALVTTGGTESNQLALLLARERHGPALRTVVGANAHHSFHRAAWLLGLPEPVVVPTPRGTLDPAALDTALAALTGPGGPVLVAATAGTTDEGLIDPLPDLAELCEARHAEFHVDAAYGGPALFSRTHRHLLTGLDRARTVTVDLHKLGWQPAAAGLLAVRDADDLAALGHTAAYLNADDDTEAGLPDLLGRSLRTTRRPDVLKTAVTLRALGRDGLGALVDACVALARDLADLVEKAPGLDLRARPTLTTVLFRPAGAEDTAVAAIRRTLLAEGRAVLGRAEADGRLWLKATLLNPHATPGDLAQLITLVEGSAHR